MWVTRCTLWVQKKSWANAKVPQVTGSHSPSLWTFLRVTEGVEMAEARKLAGRVSAESEVTPRRSFSLNIFLQEGERVNVLDPSWQTDTACEHKHGCSGKPSRKPVKPAVFPSDHYAHLVRSSLGSHGDEGVILLLQELSGLQERGDVELWGKFDTCSGCACNAVVHYFRLDMLHAFNSHSSKYETRLVIMTFQVF